MSQRPWVQKYQDKLAERAELARKRAIPDPFEGKVKPAAMSGPISAYFDQYAEWLKERASKAKEERAVRLQEIHPQPREKPKKASECVSTHFTVPKRRKVIFGFDCRCWKMAGNGD